MANFFWPKSKPIVVGTRFLVPLSDPVSKTGTCQMAQKIWPFFLVDLKFLAIFPGFFGRQGVDFLGQKVGQDMRKNEQIHGFPSCFYGYGPKNAI